MHDRREFLREQRLIRRRRAIRNVKIIFYLVLFLILFGTAAGLTHLQTLSISNIQVEGNQDTSTEEIQTIAKSHLSESIWWVFSKNNIVLAPTDIIKQSLATQFPRLSEVSISRNLINGLTIKVTERMPRALWCGDGNIDGVTGTGARAINLCYLIDENAYIYSVAEAKNSTSTDNLIKLYGPLPEGTMSTSTEFSPIGKTLTSELEFNKIISLYSDLKDINLIPDSIEINTNNAYVFNIKNNGVLYFSNKNIAQSFENLVSALHSGVFYKSNATSSKSITASSTKKGVSTSTIDMVQPAISTSSASSSFIQFKYIDTRYGNKVFYKI